MTETQGDRLKLETWIPSFDTAPHRCYQKNAIFRVTIAFMRRSAPLRLEVPPPPLDLPNHRTRLGWSSSRSVVFSSTIFRE
jgi:hypothetical protein